MSGRYRIIVMMRCHCFQPSYVLRIVTTSPPSSINPPHRNDSVTLMFTNCHNLQRKQPRNANTWRRAFRARVSFKMVVVVYFLQVYGHNTTQEFQTGFEMKARWHLCAASPTTVYHYMHTRSPMLLSTTPTTTYVIQILRNSYAIDAITCNIK